MAEIKTEWFTDWRDESREGIEKGRETREPFCGTSESPPWAPLGNENVGARPSLYSIVILGSPQQNPGYPLDPTVPLHLQKSARELWAHHIRAGGHVVIILPEPSSYRRRGGSKEVRWLARDTPWATKLILNDPVRPWRHYKMQNCLLHTQKEVGHAWNKLGAFIKCQVIWTWSVGWPHTLCCIWRRCMNKTLGNQNKPPPSQGEF